MHMNRKKPQNSVRNQQTGGTKKIVTAGVLGAVTIFLGATRLGFIPWVAGASLTIMAVPVVIGAVLQGPLVGFVIGLLFGVFSLIQAAVAPTGPADVWFTNPLVSVAPRLVIGPAAWVVYKSIARFKEVPAVIAAGAAGSMVNTVLVLTMLGLFGFLPWQVIVGIAGANGIPEAVAGAVICLAVVGPWKRLAYGKQGSSLEAENLESDTEAEEPNNAEKRETES